MTTGSAESSAPPDFTSQTARFRKELAKGRSSNQLALFDFLVERSLDERSPKEVEIALEFFGSNATKDASSDTGIRVYVHRLRKKMDQFYAGTYGPRLKIPKGEYRIVLVDVPEPEPDPSALGMARRLLTANPSLSLGLLLIVLGGFTFAAFQFWLVDSTRPNATMAERHTLFGSGAALVDPVITVGDSLFLAETEDQTRVERMILDPAISSREDLGEYIKEHPEQFYRLYDFDLHFAPEASVSAAWDVQEAMMADRGVPQIGMMPVSNIDEDDLRQHDIFYVGRLSQLGPLHSSIFAQSRFALPRFDRLADRESGKVFTATVYPEAAGREVKDIGYIAVCNGPGGRRVIVLAGLGDAGTAAMADLLRDPLGLLNLKEELGDVRMFEALFTVDSAPGRPVARNLIGVWPLSTM